MSKEDEIAKKMAEYQKLAATDKNLDVAELMLSALQQTDADFLDPKTKRRAYIISLTIPPVGLIYAAYFWLSEKKDANRTALICIGLTIFTLLVTYIIYKVIVSTAGVTTTQLQNISPSEIQNIVQ